MLAFFDRTSEGVFITIRPDEDDYAESILWDCFVEQEGRLRVRKFGEDEEAYFEIDFRPRKKK